MLPVLAHQGGWDEILIFGSPLIVYVLWRLFDRAPDDEGSDVGEEPAPSSGTGEAGE